MSANFNPQTAKLQTACEHPGTLYACCYDSGAGRLYGAGSDASIYCVKSTEGEPKSEKLWSHHDNYVSSLALLEGTLISAGYDRQLIWTDTKSGEKLHSCEAHAAWVRDLVALPEQNLIATVGDDMLVKLWDAETGSFIRAMDGHTRQTPEGYTTALYAIAASPDGKTLASGDRIGEIVLWETETGTETGRLQAPTFYTFDSRKRARAIGGIRSLCFSPDGTRLAIGGIGRVTNVDGFVGPCRVEIWDWQSGDRVFVGQDNHKAVFNHLAFHPSEPCLIAAGGGDSGGILAFWDFENDKLLQKAKPKGHLQHFVFDAAAPRILAVGFGGFQIWGFESPADSENDS